MPRRKYGPVNFRSLEIQSERSISTRFTQAYGIAHPIAAAPMAFVTLSPALPLAVAGAGAVPAFAAGVLPLRVVRNTVRAIRDQTDVPLNLNLITPFATDEHIDLCVEEQPAIVSFHWEHPSRKWLSRLHEAGIKVWEQVGTPDAAKRALDGGVDLIIAQGSEAGGHCYGKLPGLVAIPSIVDAADGALVLAAGGISDGGGLVAALALGADGVCVGTGLIATRESDVADEYKRRIIDAGPEDTVLTSLFGRDCPHFNPMRVLRNRLVEEYAGREPPATDPQREPVIGETMIAQQAVRLRRFSSCLPTKGATGDFDQMAMCSGQGAGAVRAVVPAREVVGRMVAEALETIDSLQAATNADGPCHANHQIHRLSG